MGERDYGAGVMCVSVYCTGVLACYPKSELKISSLSLHRSIAIATTQAPSLLLQVVSHPSHLSHLSDSTIPLPFG